MTGSVPPPAETQQPGPPPEEPPGLRADKAPAEPGDQQARPEPRDRYTPPDLGDVSPPGAEDLFATSEPVSDGSPTGDGTDHPRSASHRTPVEGGDGEPGWAETMGIKLAAVPEMSLAETPAPGVRAAAAAEDSFWLPRLAKAAWPAPHLLLGRSGAGHARQAGTGRAVPPHRKPPVSPAIGLSALVALALLATFFAWVSAGPLWLAFGHGDRGTATVTDCSGGGVGQRCTGQFRAADGGFTVDGVALLGVAGAQRDAGSEVVARMIGPDSTQAYVGAGTAGLHLRWMIGLLLALACGVGIALATGVRRLTNPRSRQRLVVACVSAPLALAVGFLVVAW